ncbi:MAG: spermidine synthase [Candidatus Latescibacterota bacterium]|mgnify:CR=1 FL=1|jgi:spermidine synthase
MSLGRHLLMDFYDCDPLLLNDDAHLEQALRRAATAAGASVLSAHFHRFSPQGITGVLSLRESHLAIHTWPERLFAAVDLFSCGAIDPWPAHPLLEEALQSTRSTAREEQRGESVSQRHIE